MYIKLDKKGYFQSVTEVKVDRFDPFASIFLPYSVIEASEPTEVPAKWDFEKEEWRYPSKQACEWNGEEWIHITSSDTTDDIPDSTTDNAAEERYGVVEITLNPEPVNGYYEGWKTVEYAPLKNIRNVQVSAQDVPGKAVHENVTFSSPTLTSMSVGVMSDEYFEEPMKVFWSVK